MNHNPNTIYFTFWKTDPKNLVYFTTYYKIPYYLIFNKILYHRIRIMYQCFQKNEIYMCGGVCDPVNFI